MLQFDLCNRMQPTMECVAFYNLSKLLKHCCKMKLVRVPTVENFSEMQKIGKLLSFLHQALTK